MKPLRLVFSGLNSYRAEQSIDFSVLAAQGLFGIFGVTGAGKSSVLDAITLALFGEVRRAQSGTQGMINMRGNACFVSFSFALAGHTYLAERLFERKKGEAYAANIKSCRLVRDGSEVLADKSNQMDAEIRALLGMDCDRFCQTVILPQGEFSQILNMKPKERSAMLEELFRFGAYGERLSSRAREKLKLAEAAVKALQAQLAMLGPYDGAYIDSLKENLAAAAEQDRRLEAELAAAQQRLRQAELLAQKAAEREQTRRELAELQSRQPEMADKRRRLELGERAEALRDLLQRAVAAHQLAGEAQRSADQQRIVVEDAAARERQAAQAAAAAEARLMALKAETEPRWQQLREAIFIEEQLNRDRQTLAQAERSLQTSGLRQTAERARQTAAGLRRQAAEWETSCAARRAATASALQDWQRESENLEQKRRQSAVAYLAAELRPGQPCPVCGSRDHQPAADCGAAAVDLTAQERLATAAKQRWQQEEREAAAAEQQWRNSLNEAEQAEAKRAESERALLAREADIAALARAVEERREQLARTGSETPATELQQLQQALDAAGRQAAQAAEEAQAARALLHQVQLVYSQQQSQADLLREQLEQGKQELLAQTGAAGFASAREAQTALLLAEQRQALTEELRVYGEQRYATQAACQRLEAELNNFDSGRATAEAAAVKRLEAERAAGQSEYGRLLSQLERAEADRRQADTLAAAKSAAVAEQDVLQRLVKLLKGNAFVRFLARGSMLELSHEASHILTSLTAHHYQLELFEDSRGSDFIIVDNHQGGIRRPVSGLSGGETFLVSLALALALSRKIEMHAAPLGFFFLDEGFGSLDESSLEAALTVLEKLPSDQRSVGVITHVKGVKERMPRYLEVTADPVKGSRIEMKIN